MINILGWSLTQVYLRVEGIKAWEYDGPQDEVLLDIDKFGDDKVTVWGDEGKTELEFSLS